MTLHVNYVNGNSRSIPHVRLFTVYLLAEHGAEPEVVFHRSDNTHDRISLVGVTDVWVSEK